MSLPKYVKAIFNVDRRMSYDCFILGNENKTKTNHNNERNTGIQKSKVKIRGGEVVSRAVWLFVKEVGWSISANCCNALNIFQRHCQVC